MFKLLIDFYRKIILQKAFWNINKVLKKIYLHENLASPICNLNPLLRTLQLHNTYKFNKFNSIKNYVFTVRTKSSNTLTH